MIETRGSSPNLTPIVLAIAIFSGLSLAAAISSDGFLEADACTHYLYARFAFEQPHFFVNIWGRPICTGVYAFPALLGGRLGVRIMSLILAIGCGLVAWRIARNQRMRWPALALIFTLGQPLVFLHSFSELTELPFAFLLGLGFLAFQNRWWLAFAVVIGLTPLSRPEGFGFVILAAVALVIHRRWWWIPILALPLIGWSYFGWRAYGSEGIWWKWLIVNWPYSTESAYKPGPIWHFVQFLPVFAGPILFPAMCLGVWMSARPDVREERARAWFLIGLIPAMIFVGHTILYMFGKMGSNGELRYMLIVAPFWALLSARGWEFMFTRLKWEGVYRWAGVAALLPAMANYFYKVVPLQLDDDSRQARAIVDWYGHSPLSRAFPRVGTAHQMVYYFMGTIGTDRDRALEWHRQKLATTTPGTIIVWHRIYSMYNSDDKRIVPMEDLEKAGWINITDRIPSPGPAWRFLLSPVDREGKDARETLNSLSSP